MYIKTSPMQDLPIYFYQYGHLENVEAFIVTAPPTKVLSAHGRIRRGDLDSFFCTHAFFKKILKSILLVYHPLNFRGTDYLLESFYGN
jgi:hypothetical protein